MLWLKTGTPTQPFIILIHLIQSITQFRFILLHLPPQPLSLPCINSCSILAVLAQPIPPKFPYPNIPTSFWSIVTLYFTSSSGSLPHPSYLLPSHSTIKLLSLHIDFPAWFPTLTLKRKLAISVNVFPLITSTTSPSRSVKSYLPEVERHFRSFHSLFVSSCLPVFFFGHLPPWVNFLLSFIFVSFFFTQCLLLPRYPIFTSDLISISHSFPSIFLSIFVFNNLTPSFFLKFGSKYHIETFFPHLSSPTLQLKMDKIGRNIEKEEKD